MAHLSTQTLRWLAWHIIAAILIVVLLVATSAFFRTGWLY
jgi:hypothetical protein